jgi:hypothetical protein
MVATYVNSFLELDMAKAWLRGVLPQNYANDNTDDYSPTAMEHNSILYHFLTKCLSFTHVDESTNGGSFNGNEQASDTDGSFTGSSYRFSISSSKFTSSMVGEFLVLKDPSNEENSGIYLVTNYVDANNVDIDFYTTPGTYPSSGSSIAWWMLDGSSMPRRYGDYAILESPHATSKYTLELMYMSNSHPSSGNYGGGNGKAGLGMAVVPGPASENWNSSSHAWTALAVASRYPSKRLAVHRGRTSSSLHGRIFGFGHDDGSFVSLYCHMEEGTGKLSSFTAGVITPSETTPSHDAKDYIVGFGNKHNTYYDTTRGRDRSTGDVDWGSVWSSLVYRDIPCSMQDWTDGHSRLFDRNLSGPNEYTSEYDALPVYVWADEENDNEAFALLGTFNTAHYVFTTARHLGIMKTFDSNKWIHRDNGLALPWAGFPTYF